MMRSTELLLSSTASADILRSLGSVHSRAVSSSHLPSDATASDHLIPLLTSDGALSVVVSSAPTSAADAASDETASESSDFVADEPDDAAAVEQAFDNDALDDHHVLTLLEQLAERLDRVAPAFFPVSRKRAWAHLLGLLLAQQDGRPPTALRDMYYTAPVLFGSQRFVNDGVVRIANLFGVSRDVLGVVASTRGLAFGCLRLLDSSEPDSAVLVDFSQPTTSGHPISTRIPWATLAVTTDAAFVLVVEKDAVFSRIVSSGELENLPPCFIVTGRGYPDLATRRLIGCIADQRPDLPILFLCDFDPHGIGICFQYWLARSRAAADRGNAIANARFVGPSSAVCYDQAMAAAFLSLSSHDLTRAYGLLRDADLPGALRLELQRMLHLGRKAEAEVLYARPGWLARAVLPSPAQPREPRPDRDLLTWMSPSNQNTCIS